MNAFLKLLLAVFALVSLSASALAYVPSESAVPPVLPPEHRKSAAKPKADMTKVQGRLHCSEYGTRYSSPVEIVFTNGADSYEFPFGDQDGHFEGSVPHGATYLMRVEFKGRGLDAGKLEIPAKAGPEFNKSIQIYYPGSELELIYEIRDSKRNDIAVKLQDLKEK
ncbi:MAG: hypothetical protein ACYDFU_04400 [Nitrospirota bacterium]